MYTECNSSSTTYISKTELGFRTKQKTSWNSPRKQTTVKCRKRVVSDKQQHFSVGTGTFKPVFFVFLKFSWNWKWRVVRIEGILNMVFLLYIWLLLRKWSIPKVLQNFKKSLINYVQKLKNYNLFDLSLANFLGWKWNSVIPIPSLTVA